MHRFFYFVLDIGSILWKEFRIGELFKIGTGSLLSSEELKTGKIKRVSAKSFDNGIIGEYDTESNDRTRHFENFISVNFFGDVFYHPYCASVEMKIHTLKLKDMDFNNKTGVYFASVIKKSLANKFGYGNQLSSSKLKEWDFRISVPLLKGKINFSYMEKFIGNSKHNASRNSKRILWQLDLKIII